MFSLHLKHVFALHLKHVLPCQGFGTLVLFAANRILQGGPSLVGDATKLDS